MGYKQSRAKFSWRLMKYANMVITRSWTHRRAGLVLLLTTTGRKSGLPRVTPLQYEEEDDVIYVAAARGQKADWFRNIITDPHVEVRVKARCFHAVAEPITDVPRIADFLELRLRRHPRMISAMFRFAGLPARPDRAQLEQYATKITLVAIRPRKRISPR